MINVILLAINGLNKNDGGIIWYIRQHDCNGIGHQLLVLWIFIIDNVAFFTNALIKAHNVYKEFKGEPFTPIERVELKNKNLDTLMAKVRETKAAIADFAKTGAKIFKRDKRRCWFII